MASSPIQLASEINAATRYPPPNALDQIIQLTPVNRDLHAHLNTLISSRLPLALPPHAANPDVYLTGLLPFADMYIAFEEAWDAVCGSSSGGDGDPAASVASVADDVWVDVPLDGSVSRSLHGAAGLRAAERGGGERSSVPPAAAAAAATPATARQRTVSSNRRIVRALRTLRPVGMSRAARLRSDIALLARLPDDGVAVDELLAARRLEPVRRLVEGRLAHLVASHSRSSSEVERKEGGENDGAVEGQEEDEIGPHLLLAYACVLYPAIFAGGRWLRSVLAAPGLDFWTRRRSPQPDDPLSSSAFGTASSMSASGSRAAGDIFDTRVHEKPRSFTAAQQAALEAAGLSFWFFAPGGDERGEFARRLAALDAEAEGGGGGGGGDRDRDAGLLLLDDRRRGEVVAEARAVLECCEELVGALDECVGRGGDVVAVEQPPPDEQEGEAGPLQPEAATGGAVGLAWRRGREAVGQAWRDAGGYAGVVLVLSCASVYAMYRTGYWSV